MALGDDKKPSGGERRDRPTRRQGDLEAVQKQITVAAESAAIVAARLTARRAAAGYFLLLFILLVGANLWQRSVDARFEQGLTGQCERLDINRTEEDNKNGQILWVAFQRSRDRAEKLAKQGGSQAAVQRQAVREIDELARHMKWTASTDCERAVKDPKGYAKVRPTPQPFTDRFRDLEVTPK